MEPGSRRREGPRRRDGSGSLRGAAGVALLTAVATAACGSDGAPGASFAVPDSADVEVVRTLHPIWAEGSGWSVAARPSVSVGRAAGDPAYLFQDVRSAALLGDTTLVVADGLSREIRFFGPDGVHRRTVGGAGEGPGEFGSLEWVKPCGEGLMAHDRRLRRLTVFTEAGERVRTQPLLEPQGRRGPYRSTCGPDGSVMLAGWGEPRPQAGDDAFAMYAQKAPLWRLDPNGAVVDLGSAVTSERIHSVDPASGARGSGPHPFGRSVVFAPGRDHVYIGRSERLQVEVRDLAGGLEQIWRGPDADLGVSDVDLAAYRSAVVSRPDSLLRERLEENGMPMPAGKPAYTGLVVDPTGSVWLRRFEAFRGEDERWGIFGQQGRFLGHLTMPAGFRLLSVRTDALVGVTKDSLAVERVEVHRLVRLRE